MPNASLSCVLVASGLVLQLAGCASRDPSNAAPRTQDDAALPGTDACFMTRTAYDWTVLDNSTLIVNAPGPHDYYLVKLFAPVPELAFQTRLGFESRGGELDRFCRDNGYVISRHSLRIREPVAAVRAITEAQARQLRNASSGTQPDPGRAGNAGPAGK